MYHATIFLAASIENAPPGGTQSDTWFWSSAIGVFIWSVLSAVGILVVLMSATKAMKSFSSAGKFGDGIRTVGIGMVLAAYCFMPFLINDTIHLFGGIVGKVIDTFSDLLNGGGGSTSTTTP